MVVLKKTRRGRQRGGGLGEHNNHTSKARMVSVSVVFDVFIYYFYYYVVVVISHVVIFFFSFSFFFVS